MKSYEHRLEALERVTDTLAAVDLLTPVEKSQRLAGILLYGPEERRERLLRVLPCMDVES